MRTRKPARTKERYILDSVPAIFKGGEWIEPAVENTSPASVNGSSPKGGEGVSGLGDGAEDSTSIRYITVIGGQKYDKDALHAFLPDEVDFDTLAVTGEGRGAEQQVCEHHEPWGRLRKIELSPDLYGKNARKVNVEQVLCFAPDSPLLLVGDGTRVKQARAWLDRTKSKREVIELP